MEPWEAEPHEWDECPYKGGSQELPHPFYQVETQQEGAGSGPERGPLPNDAGTLVLDFAASMSAGKKCVLFRSLPGCGVLLEQPVQTEVLDKHSLFSVTTVNSYLF